MRSWIHPLGAMALAAALAGCGGGSDRVDDALTQEVASGYAADAAMMPLMAVGAADNATVALEIGVSASGGTTTVNVTVQCPLGGSMVWSVTGATGADNLNGRLDTGETFTVSFSSCRTDAVTVLDGGMTLAVTSRNGEAIDTQFTARSLRQTIDGGGTYVLDGNYRHQRSSVTTPVGGSQTTGRWTSSGLSMTSTNGSRRASYQLRGLDWTLVRTYDASGRLIARSHDGNLELAASTPRRPNATLSIATQSALTLGSDGLAGAGSFTVRTSNDTIACTYDNDSTVLTLDRGNDGTIDRTWRLGRTVFNSEAG